jgi:hypothetical protein
MFHTRFHGVDLELHTTQNTPRMRATLWRQDVPGVIREQRKPGGTACEVSLAHRTFARVTISRFKQSRARITFQVFEFRA